MRRLGPALAAGLALGLLGARAEEPPRLCVAFAADLDRGLAQQPNSIARSGYLFEAARKGCSVEIERLLSAGASRLSRDRDGDTALAIAARAGRLPVVTTLLAGASAEERRQIDMVDAHGSTPLMLAIHSGRAKIAQTLLDAGAGVDAVNAGGETALAEAAYAADEETGLAVLKKGAKAATVDRYGKSPLCYAAARGAAGLVAALLDAGVDVDARYGHGLTALMWAAGYSDLTLAANAAATVKLLVARGAKLDLADDRGRSALQVAAALNRVETAKALLKAGADLALRDNAGKTAADLAATPEMQAVLSAGAAR